MKTLKLKAFAKGAGVFAIREATILLCAFILVSLLIAAVVSILSIATGVNLFRVVRFNPEYFRSFLNAIPRQ